MGWGKKSGAGGEFWAERRKKEKEGESGKVGLGQKKRVKGKVLRFFIRVKQIQFKLELKEFKLKLKLKQINDALKHECNTRRTTLFNLKNNQLFFIFIVNSL